MCLIAFAIGASAQWPLVIAGNRDEFFDRPTAPLALWQTPRGQTIISGRDLRAGGTWMGATPKGRVAFLTNVREADPQARPRSRGELVVRWLDDSCSTSEFADGLAPEAGEYGGFNLVVGDFTSARWTWMTNRHQGQASLHSEALAAGVYGLSNAALDTPWPKTRALKALMGHALEDQTGATDPDALLASLQAALADRRRAAREDLPQTGVPLWLEEGLSSAFVELPERGYGTRCSTQWLVSAPGAAVASGHAVRVREIVHAPPGPPGPATRGTEHETHLRLRWP